MTPESMHTTGSTYDTRIHAHYGVHLCHQNPCTQRGPPMTPESMHTTGSTYATRIHAHYTYDTRIHDIIIHGTRIHGISTTTYNGNGPLVAGPNSAPFEPSTAQLSHIHGEEAGRSSTSTFSVSTEFTVPTGKRSWHPRGMPLVTRM
jgi:hypothetical protein